MDFDWERSGIHRVYDSAREILPETRAVWIEDIRVRLAGVEVRRILDVGCGTGRYTRLLAEAFPGAARIVGVEPARGMLMEARAASRELGFLRARAEALPLRDGSFDAVVLAMVLHHLTEPETALREMGRLLDDAGLLYVLTPTRESVDTSPWLASFPGARRIAMGNLPTREGVRLQGAAGGLALREQAAVRSTFAVGPEQLLAKIGSRAISSLRQLPDAEFTAGLGALAERCGPLSGEHRFDEEIDVFVFGPPSSP